MDERATIKCYHDKGFSPSYIVKELKKLSISKQKVYRTIKRLKETGTIADRKRSGRPRSIRTPDLVNKVKCRLWRNPKQSINNMSSELQVSRRTLGRVVKIDLGLRPYKLRKLQGLSGDQKEKRLKRSKSLLKRFAKDDLENMVFSDEKLFSVQQYHNSQNVRIYAGHIEDIPEEMRTVIRFQAEKKVMVWAAVSKKGKFPLVFIEQGAKINAAYYKRLILEKVVKPHSQLMFNKEHWTFQQDSAPAHKARTTQKWCENKLPDFISTQDWPPSSPDLNPLDYFIWGTLEARVNATRHTSLDSLKAKLCDEWERLDIDTIRTAIDSWKNRLRLLIDKKGGRFE